MFVDRGGRKISKSTGNVFTPQVWYRYGSKESLNLLIYKRFVGTKSGSVDDIPVHMDELDDLEDVYFGKRKVKDELERYKLTGLYEYSHLLKPPEEHQVHTPFNLMVKLARFAPEGAEHDFIERKLDEYGYLKETTQGLEERIERALNWTKDFEEEEPVHVDLTNEEKEAVKAIVDELKKASNEDEYQAAVFNVSKSTGVKARKLFPVLYRILIGKPQGPRFGPYVGLVGKESVIKDLKAALKQ
jgi:lysyl-tRNA synthetase class 1